MKKNMNLRKGIFRIFLVLSSLWFIIYAMRQGIHWRSLINLLKQEQDQSIGR